MSYPYDAPASKLSGYWSDGAYTPFDAVGYIKDDVTPINKNAMVNSVGKQISLLQTFVNTTYLARSGNYIQDGYIRNCHVDYLIGSGYINGDNVGFVYLCSQLVPDADGSLYLGEYRNGFTHRWKEINAVQTNTNIISGLAFSTLVANGATGGSLGVASDVIPLGTNQKHIGTATYRFAGMNASGLYSNILETNYLISPDYLGPANIGNIWICSNLKPYGPGASNLGDASNRFGYLFVNEIYLNTSSTSNDGARLWVDASGYVRRLQP